MFINAIKRSHGNYREWVGIRTGDEAVIERLFAQLEYPQFCNLLSRIGRVAYHFEDKGWIHDAYGPFICRLAGGLPKELDLLDQRDLINAFYGLAWYDICAKEGMGDQGRSLGPGILDMQLEQRNRTLLVRDLMDLLMEHAIERVDDLDGTYRCQFLEGHTSSFYKRRRKSVTRGGVDEREIEREPARDTAERCISSAQEATRHVPCPSSESCLSPVGHGQTRVRGQMENCVDVPEGAVPRRTV